MKGRKPNGILEAGNELADLSRAPSWLSKDAKAEWKRVAPVLDKRKIITTGDLGSLENYCVAIGQVRECEADIRAMGIIIETNKGLRANPAVRIQADAMTRARLLAAELGLTPVSRSRPAMRQENPDDAPTIMDL